MTDFAKHLENFFIKYLIGEYGLSKHTIRAYSGNNNERNPPFVVISTVVIIIIFVIRIVLQIQTHNILFT